MWAERLTKCMVLPLAFLSMSAAASSQPLSQPLTEVLAQRSGLSPGEVVSLLASCDANPTSMKFCAWRDQLAAERTLQRLLDEKRTESPKCAAALEQKLTAWQKLRDKTCRESAAREWGDGSMLSAAVAMCETDRTKEMARSLSANSCP